MKRILALAHKDFETQIKTAPSFFVLTIFALMTGFFFFANIMDYYELITVSKNTIAQGANLPSFSQGVTSPFLVNAALVLIFIIPVITMRSFSEEKKSGTLELLFTYPVSDFQIVFAKFISSFIYLLLLVLPAFLNFFFLYWNAYQFDAAAVIVALAGLLLVAAAFMNIGVFISSVITSQTLAAISSFVLIAFWWSIGLVGHAFFGEPAWIGDVWVIGHLRQFARGVMELRQIVFYLLISVLFFFFTLISIESRSWRRDS